MKISLRSVTLAAALMLAVAVPGISSAQDTGTSAQRDDDDDGFDLGWLGLLGLGGLAGLAGRKHHNDRDAAGGRRTTA